MTGAAIDLAPARPPRLRRVRTVAGWLHLGFAGLIVTGVFVQVYLIGAYIFGAGERALDLHKSLGYTVHGFEVVLFVIALVAWLPRTDRSCRCSSPWSGRPRSCSPSRRGGRAACIRSERSSF
jgi:hypothetical protein